LSNQSLTIEDHQLQLHTLEREKQIAGNAIGELNPLSSRILITDYDPHWPELFARETERIKCLLGGRVLRIEHTGLTAVPGLRAKPIIDLLVVVADSAAQVAYVPALESEGYVLCPIGTSTECSRGRTRRFILHVLSSGCPEIDRILLFRDWLRRNAADRNLCAGTKVALAKQGVGRYPGLHGRRDRPHRGDPRAGSLKSKLNETASLGLGSLGMHHALMAIADKLPMS